MRKALREQVRNIETRPGKRPRRGIRVALLIGDHYAESMILPGEVRGVDDPETLIACKVDYLRRVAVAEIEKREGEIEATRRGRRS